MPIVLGIIQGLYTRDEKPDGISDFCLPSWCLTMSSPCNNNNRQCFLEDHELLVRLSDGRKGTLECQMEGREP